MSATTAQQRLDEIRGTAPRCSPSVRVLAGFSQNMDCHLATLGFAASVDFSKLLLGTRFHAPAGQSPFAIQRGLAFENLLRNNQYAPMLDLLRDTLRLPAHGNRVVNLREGFPAGAGRMTARLNKTSALLSELIRGEPKAACVLDGAVLTGVVGGLQAFFEADALAVHAETQELRVVEVKSFPKVDDRVDPDQLGAALDQSAVYVLLLRNTIAELGGDPLQFVSDRALLITPRNVGLTPTLSEQGVTNRVTRMQRVLANIPKAADVAAATPTGISFSAVADQKATEQLRLETLHDLADKVGTVYKPSCLTTCSNARFCRQRTVQNGSPCLIGVGAERLLPEVLTLGRVGALSQGAPPTAAETPVATLLTQANRLIDEAIQAEHIHGVCA